MLLKNKELLKQWFRIKQRSSLRVRVECENPIEKFQASLFKKFKLANLSKEAQAVYRDIVEHKMHLHEPVNLVGRIFEEYEKAERRFAPDNMANYTQDYYLFNEKLNVLNEELD